MSPNQRVERQNYGMEWNGMEWNGMIGLIDEGVDPSIYMYNEGTRRQPWGVGFEPLQMRGQSPS
jgi:hypothetical protein